MTKPISRKMAVDCLLDRVIGWYGPLPCSICKMPLLPGQSIQFDHIYADKLGGAHEYQNLRPIHYDPCHKGKSKRDIGAMAKIDRITGITGTRPKKKISSRPFQKKPK